MIAGLLLGVVGVVVMGAGLAYVWGPAVYMGGVIVLAGAAVWLDGYEKGVGR